MPHEPGQHSESCKEVFALLSAYLDAELPAQTCEEIQAHLAGCPPCIEFLESLKRSIRLCRDYKTAESPAPLDPRARQELLAAYQKMLAARQV